ncbi:MAG: rhodanese-like domain-containing protein [Jiangellales bacterium]
MRIRPLLAAAVFSVAAAVSLVGCSSDDGGTAAVTTVGAEQLIEVAETGEATVIDVRTPEEFAAGHVEGALNINVESPTFADEIEALPKDQTYVVYCRSGNRSAAAAEQMADAGFTDLYDVDAGLATLAEAGVALTQ